MIKEFKDTYRFLSNFHTCEVEYEGEIYPSTEHAFQAAKFLDPEKRKRIQRCATAGQAKRLGQDPEGFRLDWHEVRVKIMHKILKEKFTKHKKLKAALLATENQHLQEGNLWHDSFWGVDLRTGKGLNKLGKLLMLIRRQFREEEQ
jgi:ribA/ribD-fused uncharacterized protein